MAKLGVAKVDVTVETNGIWKDFFGIKFLVARHGNHLYLAEVRRLAREAAEDKQNRRNGIPTEMLNEINLRAFSKFCIKDWKDMDDDDGKPIPYSPETCYDILVKPEYHELREFLEAVSMDRREYFDDKMDTAAKNS